MAGRTLIAVDIGNSRTKLGLFDGDRANRTTGLPEPVELLVLEGTQAHDELQSEALREWLSTYATADTPLVASSVNRPRLAVLESVLADSSAAKITSLTYSQLPIEVATRQPERTGMDRLAAAVAANELRRPDRAAIVIDIGTAITVDLLTAEGVFAGGAILPGLALGGRALAEGTDALPLLATDGFESVPDAVGNDTASAIEAGLYWGSVGALRELIERQSDRLVAPPQVYVTGGHSPQFARLIGSPEYTVRHIPHLVLIGVALAAGGDPL